MNTRLLSQLPFLSLSRLAVQASSVRAPPPRRIPHISLALPPSPLPLGPLSRTMSDSPPPPSLNAPEWELRRRNAQSLSQDHAEAATPPTPTAAAESWHAQLAEARRAMAAKLEQQAQEDDERARASAEGAREAAATGRRDDSEEASEGSHRRRVSVASSEGDDELVEQLLRPRSTPTSAPVQEDEARQADADSSSAEPPAPQGPPPPQDDRVCRICFGGADDEEELGRLFSPCVCRGTVRVPSLRPARDLRRILTLLTRPSEPTCAHQVPRELAQDGGQPASVLPMPDVPLPVPVPSHHVGASHHQPACVHSHPLSTRWRS